MITHKRIVGVAFFSSLVCVVIGFCFSANATPLAVNSAILATTLPGTAGGILQADSGALAFTATSFSGTLDSKVFVNDPANPFGPGFLTFQYEVKNLAGPDSIERFNVNGYGIPGLQTDASFFPTAGALPPTSFDRSSAATAGDVVGANYSAPPLGLGLLPPGDNGEILVIHTNYTQFNLSTASLIDGSTAQVQSYSPLFTFGAPEPATVCLLAGGAIGLVLTRRRFVRSGR
ncbi:MAG TPA: PEP-CTERM sorting domain-containing protein [Pirellulales bacterium]|jgi:hypothetical protein|nr:PEP-CTERM sorting domain-containing protein [Pirellulales bacterium]